MDARPFLKWVGGKAAISDRVLAELPSKMGTYWEPCIGGGAIAFALMNERPRRFKHMVLSDKNERLIEAWSTVRDFPQRLMAVLSEMQPYTTDRQYYYDMRSRMYNDPVERAAQFIFLNKTCYRGMYRVNNDGGFNIPFGHYKKSQTLFRRDVIEACSRELRFVDLRTCDFADAFALGWPSDCYYGDPPFWPKSRTANFTKYTADDFTYADQLRLAEHAYRCADRGATVVISNSYTEEMVSMYTGVFGRHAQINVVETTHEINPYEKGAGSRKKTYELLVKLRGA